MTVYPAIDLRGGRCVRLLQGAFEQETVYGDDPVAVARGFESAGARWLHVVDLDGARAGRPLQHELVARICAAVHIPVQVGGGLRDRTAIEAALAAGAARVVIGTTAAQDPGRCGELCAAHPERIVVGLDVRDGQVRVAGWTEAVTPDPLALARRMAALGAAAIVYTDIARDGTEHGPDLEGTSAIARGVGIPVIASGGIGSLDDVRAVAACARDGVAGMIIGRALYTGAIRLRDALDVAGDR
jgi:phosphoribosylformimino-5-aminoimidazole carboxamide ribotide isomerase